MGEKMKILLIDVNCKQNSTGKIVYDLYNKFENEGHRVAICYGRGAKVNEQFILKHNNPIGVSVHALRTRFTGYVGYGSKLATKRIIKFMEEFQPDIVHLHTLHGYHVDMYMLLNYLKTKKIKVVYTLHDTCTYTGKCGHTFDCDGWLKGCGGCPQIKEYPKSLFFDQTAKEFAIKKEVFKDFNNIVFTPVSKWLCNLAQKSKILEGKNFQVVHNGLDTDIFKNRDCSYLRAQHNIKNEKIILHVTPNFDDPIKGGKFVLELASKLIKENVKIFIVGNKKIIEDIPNNVILIGRTENQIKLAEYYSMADFCLLTSSKETFSMVCAESLCCGTPILGFESGAPSEIAPEGYGVFVPYPDIKSLVNNAKLVLDGEMKFNTKEQCEKYGKENYDKRIMAKQYLKLYYSIFNI